MAEYLHPDVFVEEVSSGVRPIEGTSTSTAGFIGIALKGRPNKATFITKWEQFVAEFGAHIPGSYLAYAVQQFFENGGTRCYIVRALNDATAKTAQWTIPSRETAAARDTLRVTAKGAGAWGNDLRIVADSALENPTGAFRLIVEQGGRPVEFWENLTMDPSQLNYVESEINGASRYIEVKDLGASAALLRASGTTTNPLADPVPLNAGETLTVELPDATIRTVTFPNANPARSTVLQLVNNELNQVNLVASLDSTNHLVVTHNSPGYDRYFIVGGTATGAGRPLAGAEGFHAGTGAAIGGVLKSAVMPAGGFAVPAGGAVDFTVHGDPLTANLTPGNRTAAQIVNDLSAIFRANQDILVAGVEGDRVVVSTANRGSADSQLAVTGGTAAGVLNFRTAAGANAPISGQGKSEPAFVVSQEGPFSLANNSNFSITVNDGVLGADSVAITVSLVQGAAIPNIQEVTATQLAAVINTAAAGAVSALEENNRVVIRQSRSGNYYTLRITEGLGKPNLAIKFGEQETGGYADGDSASPYFRPALQMVAGRNLGWAPVIAGDDGSAVSNSDLTGDSANQTGMHALDSIHDVSILCIPGVSDAGVIGKAVGYCALRKDCFFIADPPGKRDRDDPATTPSEVQYFFLNRITPKNSYGALYYPWLLVDDPIGKGRNPRRWVPPSGFMAGLYARTDNAPGVWKAPAGVQATLVGPIELEFDVSNGDQDILNPYGVNCIRRFPASGIVSWGARTLAAQSDPEYRYVPVRRYAIYLETSILRGTQWAVFEPNDFPLWDSLRANIEDFLMGEFLRGALAGRTPDDAFRVKCDADLNPPSEVNAGRVNVEVKFAPLKPAEFVIIRISQKSQRPSS
jgi:phage tail sheath protein FI